MHIGKEGCAGSHCAFHQFSRETETYNHLIKQRLPIEKRKEAAEKERRGRKGGLDSERES